MHVMGFHLNEILEQAEIIYIVAKQEWLLRVTGRGNWELKAQESFLW